MQNFAEIILVVLEKKTLKFRPCIFAISILSPLGKGRGPWFTQTNFFKFRDTLCQNGWNWPSDSWKDFIFHLIKVFPLFHYNLHLGKGVVRDLNKTELPLQKDVLCLVWLKLAHMFWRTFLDFDDVFSLFSFYTVYISLEEEGSTMLKSSESVSVRSNQLCHRRGKSHINNTSVNFFSQEF